MSTTQDPDSTHHAESSGYTGRPSDKIRKFLDEVSRKNRGHGRVRLPPIRAIAKDLGISTATIYHVYRELADAGKMETTVGRGSFLLLEESPREPKQLCIGLSWPTNSHEMMNRNILVSHGILQATMKQKVPLNIRPMPAEAFSTDTQAEVLLQQMDNVDVLIHSSSMKEFKEKTSHILSIYENNKKPVILLDPPSLTTTHNAVSSNNFSAAYTIAREWRLSGRSHLAYLMRESINATVTTMFTLIGLEAGFEIEKGRSQPVTRIFAQRATEEDVGYQTMKAHLAQTKLPPDAIYCFGDQLALGAIRALEEAGINVPEDTSVIGGSGFDLSSSSIPHMTRVSFPFSVLGDELVKMALQRTSNGGADVPAVYVPGILIGGSTTRKQENDRFKALGFMH